MVRDGERWCCFQKSLDSTHDTTNGYIGRSEWHMLMCAISSLLSNNYNTGCFFYVQTLILNKNLSKLRYRGLVFFTLLCEVCGFVAYLSFECEMLKLRKSQTLQQKNTHFWIFLQQWALMIGPFFRHGIEEHMCYTQFLSYLTFNIPTTCMQVTHCCK